MEPTNPVNAMSQHPSQVSPSGLAILSLGQIQGDREPYYQQALNIFWETSQQEGFASQKEEEQYLRKYFQYYWELEPELFLLAIDPSLSHNQTLSDNQSSQVSAANIGTVLGYVCAVADTRNHLELYDLASHIPLFDDLYQEYPAHLHINLTAQAQGKGLGGLLIGDLETRLQALGVGGLHLVTGSNARNQSFYARCGFEHQVIRGSGPVKALFMGKKL